LDEYSIAWSSCFHLGNKRNQSVLLVKIRQLEWSLMAESIRPQQKRRIFMTGVTNSPFRKTFEFFYFSLQKVAIFLQFTLKLNSPVQDFCLFFIFFLCIAEDTSSVDMEFEKKINPSKRFAISETLAVTNQIRTLDPPTLNSSSVPSA